MGYHHHSKILHIFIIIILTLISFDCAHILMVDAAALNAAEYLNGQGLMEMYYMESKRDVKENHIEKVSGEDENEEQESLILEKFRNLLGLRSFSRRKPANGDSGNSSPSPSPSPARSIVAEALAPSPALPIHRHSHPATHHHHHPLPSADKIQQKDRGKAERIVAAAVVSAAVTILLCAAALFWGRGKLTRRRKKKSAAFSIKSKYVSSQSSVKKVSSDPGPDLFYLDSLEVAFETEAISLKHNTETLSHNTVNFTSNEREESDIESIKEECENGYCSASREITCVHEAVAETKTDEQEIYLISSCEKIMQEEANASDDESFHSFSDSLSAKNRLSNASGSFGDTTEIISPNASKVSDFSMASPSHSQTSFQETVAVSDTVPSSESHPPLAPGIPAPPPPPPLLLILSAQPTFSSTRMTPKILTSSPLPNESSTGNSDFSSASNQTTQCGAPASLPNPAKPPGGIPPPPRPPPLPNGNTNSLKGPPPPPPQFSQYTALGKDGAPLPKLKPLHWDKVRAAPDRSTVWDKLRSSSFEFDEEMIKSLFGYNLQNSMKNDEVKSKTPSPRKHVLEPKRLQNITILSKALNMTAEQICDALIRGNGLSLQELEALAKMMPTKEEESKLSNYKGDINELGSAEKFVRAMLKIPFAFSRIEAMLYKEIFDDEVVHLRKSFSMLEEACKELRSSRLFLKLLEAVLKTGNRMNVGTIRGGARAFKLDALLKLADVKATDGKTTLLHFVVQEIVRSEGFRVSESIMGKINQRSKSGNIEDKEEDYKRMGLELVSGLGTELCNVKKTATLDLDVLASSVSNLSEGMSKLHHLVNEDLSSEENNESFVHAMITFLKYAEKNLKELQDDENIVLLHVREITEYFHGDVSKEEKNPLRIFVIVRDFLCLLDHVCKELRNSKAPASPNPLAPFR